MKAYISKIKTKKALNIKTFRKRFDTFFPDKVFSNIFDVKELSSKEALIYIKDHQAFDEIVRRVEEADNTEGTKRLKATIKGDSHKEAVSTYYILVFHQNTGFIKPDVVVVNEECIFHEFQTKKNLLVIENQENFAHLKEHLAFMNKLDINNDNSYSLESYDVMFSSGGSLTSKVVSQYLSKYKNIVFSLDIDIGGVNIYSMMTKHLSDNISCSFWIPSNLSYLLEKYGSYLSDLELSELYSNQNFKKQELLPLLKVVSNTHKKLEQEIFLHPKFIEANE